MKIAINVIGLVFIFGALYQLVTHPVAVGALEQGGVGLINSSERALGINA